jgi:hypothetical protein
MKVHLIFLLPLLCTADPCLTPQSLACWEYRMGMGQMWGIDVGTNPPHTCTDSHVCYKLPNTTDPCEALKSKRILFCGDVRHAYEGLALLLSNDYETGAIKNDPACAGEAQFGEKGCKVPSHFDICGVRIELRYNAQLSFNDHVYDWVVWGHEMLPPIEEQLDHLCISVAKFSEKMIILNNHHVLHNQQRNEQIQHLNDQSQKYLRHRCNITRFVDTFAMTSELSRAEPNPGKLTHDGVHWGRMVNVVKAWMTTAMMMQ